MAPSVHDISRSSLEARQPPVEAPEFDLPEELSVALNLVLGPPVLQDVETASTVGLGPSEPPWPSSPLPLLDGSHDCSKWIGPCRSYGKRWRSPFAHHGRSVPKHHVMKELVRGTLIQVTLQVPSFPTRGYEATIL